MAGKAKGGVMELDKKTANGHVGKHMNGSADKQISRRPKAVKRRRSFAGRSISVITRLVLWYSLITVVFRCPSTSYKLTEKSPSICDSYLDAKEYLQPHIQPYYDAHFAPHVESIRPYADRFKRKVYKPTVAFSKHTYEAYGAPRAAKLREYVAAEWQRSVQPPIEAAWSRVKTEYGVYLAPHVDKASDTLRPHYENAQHTVLDIYHTTLLPTYNVAVPYVEEAYHIGNYLALDVALPYSQWAVESTWVFLQRTVWPHVRILYGENVEPQLKRISDRLGRYKDRKKLEAAVDKVESSASSSSVSSKSSSKSSSKAASKSKGTSKKTRSTKSKTASSTEKPVSETVEKARAQISSDLATWQEKFATAADEGTIALEDGIEEALEKQIESQAHGVGMAYVTTLEETVRSAVQDLRSTIKTVIQQLPENAAEDQIDSAYQELLDATRASGLSIRQKAQKVRAWREKYDQDNTEHVQAAAQSTLKVIDEIRNLGLHEIGMRWTWMDGVTYKDWAKFHELRNNWGAWRQEIASIANDHDAIARAAEEGNKVEEKAMAIAENAAKELGRLKNVARWKLDARDASDDFSDRVLPPKVAKAAGKLKDATDAVKSAATGSTKTDSVPEMASSKIANAASSVSSALAESVSAPIVNSVSAISKGVMGSGQPHSEDDAANGAASDLKSRATSIVSAAKEKTIEISKAIHGTPAPPQKPVVGHENADKRVWGGAMAQVVEARQEGFADPIDDEDEEDGSSYYETIQSLVGGAGDKASELSSVLSEALMGTTKTQGTVESATSVAGEQYERALSAASRVLYGTESAATEMAASAFSDKYAQAVAAASNAIHGTPTPIAQSMAAEANSRYQDAVNVAKEQYQLAKSRVSVQVSGTPKPVHEQMMSSIEKAYSGSLAAASEKLQSALKYTESLQPTQGPMQAMSSIASSRLADGLSLASAQYTSAKVAVGAQPTPVHQQYMAEAQRRYYEGIGVAHARYSEFLEEASKAVYGTPTPAYQSYMSAASASVMGTSTPAYESMLSAAQDQYSAAVAAASGNLQQVLGSAKSAVGATKKSPAQSVVDSASEQYNAAVSAASESLSVASSRASVAVFGEPTGTMGSAASAIRGSAEYASQNWDFLISKASEQIYGTPTAYSDAVMSNAGDYAAQATDAVAAQYAALQALVSDLVVGKEPDFTESVMNRLQSAYHTGAPAMASSASSYANEAYNSASSVVSTVFTPPATLEAILGSASDQINAAVDAASVQIYGTKKGTAERASSSAASVYSSVQAKASEAVYGTQPSYMEAAQSSFADIASSAQDAISAAIYGTPTGTVEAATSSAASAYSSASKAVESNVSGAASVVGDTYASASSIVGDNYAAAKSRVSSAVYGPEQGAVESATNRLAAAVESARARLKEFAENSSEAAGAKVEEVRSSIEEMASAVSIAASSATSREKDEL